MPYVAFYKSNDPKRRMLGGVRESESSRFERREDAELRLRSVVDVHQKLDTPLEVIGEVREVSGTIEIFADGSTIGCDWGQAKQARKVSR